MKRLLFLILLLPCLVYGQTVGIKVASPIIKNSPSDNTVTGYANLLNGGYHITPTISGRDSLNTSYSKTLKTGMLCYVTGVDSTYRWDGSTWIVQGSGNVTLSQLTDSLSNYTPLQDGLINGGSATIGTGSVTIDTAIYRINKVNYTSLPRTFTGISNSASGTSYYILVYGKNDNTLDTLQGIQDTIAVIPTKPSGTVSINNILVGDGGVVSANPDLSGYALTNGSNASGTWDINITGISGDSNKFNGIGYGGSNYSLVPDYIATYDSVSNSIELSNKIGVKTFLDLSGVNTGDETFSSITSKLGFTPYNPASYPINSGGETLQSVTSRGASTTNQLSIGGASSFSGNKLTLLGNILYSNYDGQLTISDSSYPNKRVGIGYDGTNNFAFIQPFENTVGVKDLMLNPSGGNVAIGYTSSQSANFAVNGTGLFSSTLTANSFIKSGGTSSQFLKADGSVDASTYLPLTGGTLTGKLNFSAGTTSNSSFKLPNGVAPTTPVSGDWWSLTTGLRTQNYDGTQTKDVIFDKANSVFAGLGTGMIATNNSGDLSVVPIADRLTTNVISKTANYTVTLSDVGANGEVLVRADATSGNITITLPVASTATGLNFIVKKTDSSVNTVTVSVASTIDGTSTKVYNTQYSGARITSNGTTYSITGGF